MRRRIRFSDNRELPRPNASAHITPSGMESELSYVSCHGSQRAPLLRRSRRHAIVAWTLSRESLSSPVGLHCVDRVLPPGRRWNNSSAHRCPIERTATLIGDRWTPLIVRDLAPGCRRFSELQRSLGGISPKTLSDRLRRLEEAGVITRACFAEMPPRVEYRLTDKGLALLERHREHARLRC